MRIFRILKHEVWLLDMPMKIQSKKNLSDQTEKANVYKSKEIVGALAKTPTIQAIYALFGQTGTRQMSGFVPEKSPTNTTALIELNNCRW